MLFPDQMNLGEAFSRYFKVVPAWTDELKEASFRIRHQVYCEDCGFEPRRADRRETDEYDDQSLHLLTQCVTTGEYVGCVRVVLNRPDALSAPLPLERACGDTLDKSLLDLTGVPRSQLAEVSRLAIIPRYRRRKGEAKSPAAIGDDDFGNSEQPRFPFIPLGLYFGAVELAHLVHVDTLLFLTEERLAAHFCKLGVSLVRIGPAVEHHGLRIPSLLDTTTVESKLWHSVKPLYSLVADEIRHSAPPAFLATSRLS